MAKLSKSGEKILASKNITTHTRIYVNDDLQIDTSTGYVGTPIVAYRINRSRKLGAAKIQLNVSNPGGMYSFRRQNDPIFGYGNRIRVEEGLVVGNQVEWFIRFTGIITSQVASNSGGMPSLQVEAMDRMKLLLDYLPDELVYRPQMVKVAGERLDAVGDSFQHYRSNSNKLPWADIPYPIFYKNGQKLKENYEIDLINGEVYFGEKMFNPQWGELSYVNSVTYAYGAALRGDITIYRSFRLVRQDSMGNYRGEQQFTKVNLPDHMTYYVSGNQVFFNQDPFYDLSGGSDWKYVDKKLIITLNGATLVTCDYWYYNDQTNLAENVIRDLALRAGFKEAEIDLAPTGVSLKTLRFTNSTIKSGFEALQKVKQQLGPNYIITCDCDGKLRGYYAAQMATADYTLELIQKIDAPVSEESLFTAVVAHGVDLNPEDLAKTAWAENLLHPHSITKDTVVKNSVKSILANTNYTSGSHNLIGNNSTTTKQEEIGTVGVGGHPSFLLNKSADDQISWHWRQKNEDTPPVFPIDLVKITLQAPKEIEEISLLTGDYNGGTIEQTLSVLVSENGSDWFYIDRNSRGVHGASSQWLTLKEGELLNRKISHIKIRVEAAFNWSESHTKSKTSGSFLNKKTKVTTDNYYNWYVALKEVQIWEKKEIQLTSVLANYLGMGDGKTQKFYLANKPFMKGSERIYVDGIQLHFDAYQTNPATGEIHFTFPPTGVITCDYAIAIREKAVSQSNKNDQYGNNISVINPPGTLVFTGGDIAKDSPEHRLLKKIGLKKVALYPDNYLNTYPSLQQRGKEMLQEITRLEETLAIEAVYRPDIDICQTVHVIDPMLGIQDLFFIEEITEGKEGYRPTVNIRVSRYA